MEAENRYFQKHIRILLILLIAAVTLSSELGNAQATSSTRLH